jgi:hypothetical protein
MTVGSMEMQRARRALQAFCDQRNRLAVAESPLICVQESDALLIARRSAEGGADNPLRTRALVRLCHAGDRWRVFVPDRDGRWQPYPHLQETDDVQRIIAELDQAPLQVHW